MIVPPSGQLAPSEASATSKAPRNADSPSAPASGKFLAPTARLAISPSHAASQQRLPSSSARVPLRSSRSQALAVLRPLIKALNVKRLLPHGKQIAEALSDSSLATSREVGERKRHFSAIRTLSEKLVDDIQKASAAHFQSTGRFISIEQPLRRLHEAMGDMLALAEEDASNNVVGGDELLKEATMAKDSLDTLVSKFGESNNNIIGGGKVVKASVEGEKEDENDINMEEDSSELFGVE